MTNIRDALGTSYIDWERSEYLIMVKSLYFLQDGSMGIASSFETLDIGNRRSYVLPYAVLLQADYRTKSLL